MRKDIENYNISLEDEVQNIEDETLIEEITRRIDAFQEISSKYPTSLQEALINLNEEGKEEEILEIKIAIAELQEVYDIINKNGIESLKLEDLNT